MEESKLWAKCSPFFALLLVYRGGQVGRQIGINLRVSKRHEGVSEDRWMHDSSRKSVRRKTSKATSTPQEATSEVSRRRLEGSSLLRLFPRPSFIQMD